MMSRLESRIDTSEVIRQDLAKFAKKALEESQRLFDDSGANLRSVERETDTEPKGEEPELLYDGVKGQVNLLALGGFIDADKNWLLATNIWTLDELRTQFVDFERTAKENSRVRGPTDPDKTEIIKEATRQVLEQRLTEKLYKGILYLVNQRGRDIKKKLDVPGINETPEQISL